MITPMRPRMPIHGAWALSGLAAGWTIELSLIYRLGTDFDFFSPS
jgi:hypothetical protein